ncbi:MAG: hypothetical protein P4L39_01365 [Humidesulfovibrio sp.]|nr:hypothetical protein [Humidesulfovibrio sp.]
MFLDADLEDIGRAKARLAVQADLRRQVIQLEVLALRSRARRAMSSLTLGLGLAGKIFDFLHDRRKKG